MNEQAAVPHRSITSQPRSIEKGLSLVVPVFSVAFAIFVLGPPFLGYTFGPYPLMDVADVFDLFTPLVVLPLYWLLFRLEGDKPASLVENLAFMVLAGLWVLGQSMHLTANSIGHLTETMPSTDVYNLTYFYDERLGHYLWHLGVIGLSALLIYRQWKNPLTERRIFTWGNVLAGILYGFTFFAMVNEGGTVPVGLPFAVLAVIFILVWGRRRLNQQPLLFWFLTAYSLAILLFAIWGIWHQGFPGFFEVGIV